MIRLIYIATVALFIIKISSSPVDKSLPSSNKDKDHYYDQIFANDQTSEDDYGSRSDEIKTSSENDKALDDDYDDYLEYISSSENDETTDNDYQETKPSSENDQTSEDDYDDYLEYISSSENNQSSENGNDYQENDK